MIKQELPFGTAVRVYWVDSAIHHGWSQAEDASIVRIVSLGYVVRCDDDFLAIANSITTLEGVACPMAIPWQAIVQVQNLPEVWSRNPVKLMEAV